MEIRDDEYRGQVAAVKLLIIMISLLFAFLSGVASKYLFIICKAMEMCFTKVLITSLAVLALFACLGFLAAIIACVVWKVND